MVNSTTAQTIVIAGVGTAVLFTVIQELTGDPTKRAPAVYVPLGGVFILVPLLVMAEVEPGLAAAIGALIGIGGILFNSKAINSLTGTLNTKKLPPNPSSSQP